MNVDKYYIEHVFENNNYVLFGMRMHAVEYYQRITDFSDFRVAALTSMQHEVEI